jgi:branched-chain amino acid transport system substrate-binding protein
MVLALTLIASSVGAAEPVKVGVVQPLTGVLSTLGIPAYRAYQVAADELMRDKGGILGRRIEFIARDSSTTETETRFIREMFIREKCDIVMAGCGSGLALAATAVAADLKKLVFVIGGASTKITEENFTRYMFRMQAPTNVWSRASAPIVANEVLKGIDNPTVYWLSWDYEFGRNLWKYFKEDMEKLKPGIKWIEGWTKLGETNYAPYISIIAAKKPDAVVSTIWGGGIPAFFKQAKPFNLWKDIGLYMLGQTGGYEYVRMAGKDYPEGVWTNCYDQPELPDHPIHREYVKRFYNKWGDYPGGFAAPNYYMMHLYAAGVEMAGTTETEAVIDAMEKVRLKYWSGDMYLRKCDHQSSIGLLHGPLVEIDEFPYRKMDASRAFYVKPEEIWHTCEEVEAIREAAKK